MHIIQVQTIDAWKGAQERPGKRRSCHLVNSHAFYKEWTYISRKCVAIVNHKRVIYWVNNYTKMKYMLGKHMTPGLVPWYDLTVPWLKVEKAWFMSSCTPFRNRTITEEVRCFREGNHQDWRGIQFSVLVCHSVFVFNDQHTASNETCSNFSFFRTHLPYLGDCVHFLGINYAHNSNSNNRCTKGAQEQYGKPCSCYLVNSHAFYKE